MLPGSFGLSSAGSAGGIFPNATSAPNFVDHGGFKFGVKWRHLSKRLD
jgi:hypothetical protein